MSLSDDFNSWMKEAINGPPPGYLFSYTTTMKCIEDAERCINAGYHVEFCEGILKASQILQDYVTEYHPNHVTLLNAFAKLTLETPEESLAHFVPLVLELDQPHASGAKFVMAHLILIYGTLGKYPNEGRPNEMILRNVGMIGAATGILKHLQTLSEKT